MTKILIVEADPAMSLFIAEVLSAGSTVNVKCVATAALAGHALDQEVFHAAIIDLDMPSMLGFELAKRAANKSIPTLLCTGNPDIITQLKEHHLPHLSKPFRSGELIHEATKMTASVADNTPQAHEANSKLHLISNRLQNEQSAAAERQRQAQFPRVLLVQDEPFLRDRLSAMLHDRGFRATTFSSADGAFRILHRQQINFLMTDFDLPGSFNGIELAALARRRYPDLPVIFLRKMIHPMSKISINRPPLYGSRLNRSKFWQPFSVLRATRWPDDATLWRGASMARWRIIQTTGSSWRNRRRCQSGRSGTEEAFPPGLALCDWFNCRGLEAPGRKRKNPAPLW